MNLSKTFLSVLGVILFSFGTMNGASALNPLKPVKDLACDNNLKQIGIAMLAYAEENKGQFPKGDAEAVMKALKDNQSLPDTEIWRCAGRKKTEKVPSYIVISGLSTQASKSMPLVMDKLGSHQGSINVLRVNGSVTKIQTDATTYSALLKYFTGITDKEKAILKSQFEKLDSADKK